MYSPATSRPTKADCLTLGLWHDLTLQSILPERAASE